MERQKIMVILPRELITEILLRLPMKYLIRCKCVCKLWLSLISDPYFAQWHFELGAARTERLVLIAPAVPKTLSIDLNAPLNDDSASVSLKANFLFPEPCYLLRIVGCCRGFLLLSCIYRHQGLCLCVWNPSTGVHKFVKWSQVATGYFPFLHGLGYDPSTDDYLVVQFQGSRYPNKIDPNDLATHGKFFSLRADAWKEFENVHLCHWKFFHIHLRAYEMGRFLNGAIHWLTFNSDVSKNVILAFDLIERSFSEIDLPFDFETNISNCWFFGAHGESLSLAVIGRDLRVEMWVMGEYKVQSSWTKITFGPLIHVYNRYFFPICSTKSGEIVVTDRCDMVAKSNDQGQLQEHRTYCIDPGGIQVGNRLEDQRELIAVIQVASRWLCIQSLYFHCLVTASRHGKTTNNRELLIPLLFSR